MGKRGRSSKRKQWKPRIPKKSTHHERRSQEYQDREVVERRKANRISNAIIVCAVWTVANFIMAAYGVLPWPWMFFLATQWTILGIIYVLSYFLLIWNSRIPVYRETYWMLYIYVPATSIVTGAATFNAF